MIRNLSIKLLFGLGFLGGSQLPKFIGDYRQYLSGQLDQANTDLALFQAIADRFHGGSLTALIQRHLNSTDPTFIAEGAAIQELADQVTRLTESITGLQGNLPQQIASLIRYADPDTATASWALFQPGLVFTPEALLCALITGLVFSLPAFGLLPLFRRPARMKKAGTPHLRG